MNRIDKLHFVENSVLCHVTMTDIEADLRDAEDIYDLREYLRSKNLMIGYRSTGVVIKRLLDDGESKIIAGGNHI